MKTSKPIPARLLGILAFASFAFTVNAQSDVTLTPVDTAVTDNLEPQNVGPTALTTLDDLVFTQLPIPAGLDPADFAIRERRVATQNNRRISAFFQFDVSDPALATLFSDPAFSATLTLDYVGQLNGVNSAAASIGQVTQAAWDSDVSTVDILPPRHLYGVGSAEFTAASNTVPVLADIAAVSPTGQTLEVDVTTTVRNWGDGTDPNFGFILFIPILEAQAAGFNNPVLTLSVILDSDDDGLPDEYEMANTDPANPLNINDATDASNDLDANGGPDGLTNLEEFIAGTDPQDSDTDDDTLNDGAELDGSSNPFETIALDAPPETPPGATDPLNPDSDNDGILDGVELLSLTFTPPGGSPTSVVTDPNSDDTDDDFLLDNFEASNGLDPTDAEGDNGDAGDLDNDTVDNFNEQAFGINPNDDDSDNDGLPDGANFSAGEVGELDTTDSVNPTLVTDPADADTDGDGLSDDIEFDQSVDPNPATIADRDGDTFADGVEVSAGSDPDDVASIPTLANITWIADELASETALLTSGTLLFAENLNGPATTVNGIPFTSAIDNFGPRTSTNLITGNVGSLADASLYDDEDPALSPLLESLWTGGTERMISIFGLTPGLTYAIQIGRSDDRAIGAVTRSFLALNGVGGDVATDSVGVTNTIFSGAENPAIIFTGGFTATATVQSFELEERRIGGALPTSNFSFIQVRQTDDIPTGPPVDIAVVSCEFNGAAFDITFENLDPTASYRLVRSADFQDGFPTEVVAPRLTTGGATVDTFSDPAPDEAETFYRLEEVPNS